jgi:CBS-domain-containing membrane protein
MKELFLKYLGIAPHHAGHKEKLVSALGGFVAIFSVIYTSTFFVQGTASYIIVASMGASTVLLFAVPHGPLSQPWSVIGGHLISAVIGVSCAKFVPDVFIAASLAVGIAVGAMYYLHCIHPPGGATALSAVVSGTQVEQLGYQFVITPVLVNVIAILTVAVVFNYFFPWRRYPAWLMQKATTAAEPDKSYSDITHEDFVYALSELDSFIDISESDLLRIYGLVTKRHHEIAIEHHELKLGHYYCNGEYGDLWSVRQIIDWADTGNSPEEKLIYKIITGNNRNETGVMSKQEFSRWARYEVIRDENNWQRVDSAE